MKKEKKAGEIDQFLEIFIGEWVEMTVDMSSGNSDHFVVRGMLLGSDNLYYYLGETKAGVSAAIKKDYVVTTVLYNPDEARLEEVLNNMKKPDDGDFN